MLIHETKDVHSNRRDLHNLRAILPYLMDFRGRALFALACLVLSKVANVGVPVALKAIVDFLEGHKEQVLILPVALLFAYGALRLSSSLFNELRDTIFARVRYRAMRRLSTRVLAHLHELSLRFHLDRKTGAISRDMERGTRSVGSIMNYMAFSILPVMVEFTLVAVILLSQYSLVFTLVTFGTVVIYVTYTYFLTEWRMEYRHEMNRLDSKSHTYAIDSLINYETVKYFNNEKLEIERVDSTLAQWEEVAVKSQSTMSLLNFGQASIIAIGVTVIMFFSAKAVISEEMSIGDLVMVNAFMLQLFIPLGALGIIYRQVKYTLADMDLVFKLLEKKPEVTDKKDANELQISQGKVEFKSVNFSYQPERPILQGVSFTIEPGQTVAIVGRSGAGKSTLSRLLFRFYDIADTGKGCILIDGQNIANVTQSSLRKAIGIVPQDTVLFNESIFYNLHYGNLDASREDVVRVAEMAHIKDFIESLPDGWNTIVGERGLKLSGGEKQRVAIARALLKQPAILIFDEATSSLDSGTESVIQNTLQSISDQHTTLVIAHRLSTIVDADQILVLDQGEIIERGTHQELLAAQGIYNEMWLRQQ